MLLIICCWYFLIIWFLGHILTIKYILIYSCDCSVTKLCPTLWDPMNCSTPGSPVLHCLLEFAQGHVHCVGDAIQPSYPLSPLLFLPSVFPSIRVFSNGFTLCIRWPKYWHFSFSISPSNEYSGLISFRMDWSISVSIVKWSSQEV